MSASIRQGRAIHRRDFLGFGWSHSSDHQRQFASDTNVGAMIALRARPDRLRAVENAIAAEGWPVVTDDAAGRLTVTVPSQGFVPAALSFLSDLPGVVDAALIGPCTPEAST